MEIVQSCLFYRNVVSVSFDWVKVWYSQGEDIQNAWFQQILILIFDAGLSRVKKGQELPGSNFLLVVALLLSLLSICVVVGLLCLLCFFR